MNTSAKKSGTAIILLCSLVYFVSYFARKDFAAVMVSMIDQDIIDKALGGFIGMGLFIAYGIGQLVSWNFTYLFCNNHYGIFARRYRVMATNTL